MQIWENNYRGHNVGNIASPQVMKPQWIISSTGLSKHLNRATKKPRTVSTVPSATSKGGMRVYQLPNTSRCLRAEI